MASPATYIGIDPSYSGLAIVAIDDVEAKVYSSQLLTFPKGDFASQSERLSAIEQEMHLCLGSYGSIVRVAMEGYAYGSKVGRELAGELHGVILTLLYQTGSDLDPLRPSPQSVKKYALGSGKGQAKDQMALGVYKKWGVDMKDNNLTDAFVLAQIARDYDLFERDGRIPGHGYEFEVIKKLAEKS